MVIWHTCLMVMCHLMVTWRVFRVVGSSETSWSFSSMRRVTAWYSQGKRMNSDGVSSSNWDWPAGLHDNGHVRVLILLMDLDLDRISPIRSLHFETTVHDAIHDISCGSQLIHLKTNSFLWFFLCRGGGVTVHQSPWRGCETFLTKSWDTDQVWVIVVIWNIWIWGYLFVCSLLFRCKNPSFVYKFLRSNVTKVTSF